MNVLSVRLDEDLKKKLDYLMKKQKIFDKSTYIRQLLDKSLSEELIRVLCDQVKDQKMTAWKAAEIANISLRKMLNELKKKNITGYDERSLKEDIEFALE